MAHRRTQAPARIVTDYQLAIELTRSDPIVGRTYQGILLALERLRGLARNAARDCTDGSIHTASLLRATGRGHDGLEARGERDFDWLETARAELDRIVAEAP